MVRFVSLIVLLALSYHPSFVRGQQKIKGSGYVLTQERETDYFNSITVSNRISVYIVQGELQPITVEADNNLFPYVKTVVRNRTLKIYISDTVDIVRFADMNVLISMPELSTLTARQSSYIDGFSQHWKTDQVTLRAGSDSRIKLATESNTIIVDGKSSSLIELKGKTNQLTATLKTGTKLIARELKTNDATLHLGTDSKAEVRVREQIAYDLSGYSRLIIKGNPRVTQSEVNSGSKVIRDK